LDNPDLSFLFGRKSNDYPGREYTNIQLVEKVVLPIVNVKQILRKNVDNKETTIYNSIAEACISNNLSRSHILTIIRNTQTICGYKFLFYEVEDIV